MLTAIVGIPKIFQEKFMTQYSKRMVIVHWLTLGLLIAAWLLGDAVNEARKEEGATLRVMRCTGW